MTSTTSFELHKKRGAFFRTCVWGGTMGSEKHSARQVEVTGGGKERF